MRRKEQAIDYFRRQRIFFCQAEGNPEPQRHLEDTIQRVRTYYFNFSFDRDFPGKDIVAPPPWQPQTVSAHANASDVATFFRYVLNYYPLEENTSQYNSTIVSIEDNTPGEHPDAFWSADYQYAFFGQQRIFNSNQDCHELCCYAVAKDIVAHEFTHALTTWTVGLDYSGESGALDESYADIFAILIKNFPNRNIEQWNWEIGTGFGTDGSALRSLQYPNQYHTTIFFNGNNQKINHPEHLSNYYELQWTREQDWGGVHINCGIHNKAAYNLLNSKSERDGKYIFKPKIASEIFYQALTQLRPDSGFSDSRRAIRNTIATLYRHSSSREREERLRAIANAFDEVGISE
ncbi:MAG: M4 family metallopeptidase [Scytonema sp. PMC 1069.18]|nr:M4 family metallopeptidase [Scytonema sp. PMC 1069.18]MEC4882945.1 M4 family metallopeptidase [Scytonema sp. PMC 1070.18]